MDGFTAEALRFRRFCDMIRCSDGERVIGVNRICCFTGYRPHRFAFSPDGLRPEHVQEALRRQIGRLYDEGYRTFITGMCVGVDLWAAEAVIALQSVHPDAMLVAAIPFEGQEAVWPLSARRQYRRVREMCQRVEVLSKTGGSAAYLRRNRWMVDSADTVLAVYALGTDDVRSGTAATVRYARQKQRRILYIDPVTLDTSEETVQQLQFTMD